MNALTGDRTEAASFGVVCRILDLYDRDPGMIIPILQKVQEEYRYLPEEVLLFWRRVWKFLRPVFTVSLPFTAIFLWSRRESM